MQLSSGFRQVLYLTLAVGRLCIQCNVLTAHHSFNTAGTCLQNWQGRSWNRLSLHHQIHRSRHLASAAVPHTVTAAHSRRSVSTSPDRAPSSSPVKPLAAARLASEAAAGAAQRPLQQESANGLPSVSAAESRHTGAAPVAVVAKAHVKRKLLHMVSDKDQQKQPAQRQQQPAAQAHLPTARTEAHGTVGPHTADDGDRASKHIGSGLGLGLSGQNPPAEHGSTAAEQQPPQQLSVQEQAAQSNGNAPVKVDLTNVKQFLNGMRPDLATWEDVEPDLAKQAASLNR